MRPMNTKSWLMAGAAVAVVLIGGGYAAYQMTTPDETVASDEAAEGEEGHAEEEGGEEGHVDLTPAQIEAANIDVVSVGRGGGAETHIAGRVEPMVDARASVAASISGRVERVLVAPGQPVRVGQALAVLVSGDAAGLRADADAAAAAANAARAAYERERNLQEQGVVSVQSVEAAQAAYLSAEASARAARARAGAAGGPSASGRVNVTSPISGVVTNVQVGPGGFVAQGGVVAEVSNPSRVELVFNAPPAVAARVSIGSIIRVDGPNGGFEATVTGVAADTGEESNATLIRARANSASSLAAGSAVTGAVVTDASGGLTVPVEAVQTVEGRTVVFVRTDDGFRAVTVLTGRESGDRIEIVQGLTGDEQIAARNAFLLKAQLGGGGDAHGH